MSVVGFAGTAAADAGKTPNSPVFKKLGPFELHMEARSWSRIVGTASVETIQRAVGASPTGTLRGKHGVERASQMAAGAIVFVALGHKRCARHLQRVARKDGACVFVFSKVGHDDPYRLFEISVEYDLPSNASFEQMLDKYKQKYGRPTFDKQVRQPVTAPPGRSLVWKLRAHNTNLMLHLNQRGSAQVPYRFSLTASEPYQGGTRYGRRVRRMHMQGVVLD